MKHRPMRVALAILLMATSLGVFIGPVTAGAWYAGTAFPICEESGPQNYAAIDGDIIVWRDGRDGTCGDDGTAWNIWMYDLSTGEERPVTVEDKKQMYPEVSGDTVVYQTDQNCNSDGNADVYMYSVSADEISAVCTDTAWQGLPDVSDGTVVWQDRRNGNDDIFGRDLSTGAEFEICTDGSYQYEPRVSGDVVVWEDNRNGEYDIFMYDLGTGEESEVCTATGEQDDCDVDGDIVVWMDNRGSYEAVYMKDLSSGEETMVVQETEDFDIYDPTVNGNYIAWQEYSGEGDICLYDIEAGTMTKVAQTDECEGMPAIGDGVIAFNRYDDAEGDPDLMAVAFEDIPTAYVSVAGPTRYETAVLSSQESYPEGADSVIIATGSNWPDALGASALAGVYDAPILLTGPDSIPDCVSDEIERLGAQNAFIIGGTEVISNAVADDLAALGLDVTRLGGADRYETACIVASETVDANPDWGGGAFVTTGLNFPDALSAAPLASHAGMPIFLSQADGISEETEGCMDEIGVSSLLVLGGTGVVPADVMASGTTTLEYERLGGLTRYGTALAVATWGAENLGMHWNHLALATGENYPDALAAGAAQGQVGALMLLTPSDYLDSATAAGIAAHKMQIGNMVYVGGESAVAQAVRDAVAELLP